MQSDAFVVGERNSPDVNLVAGFAGATADAVTLLDRFEEKLEAFNGKLDRAAVELARDWRTDKYLRRLEAMLAIVSKDKIGRAHV